VQHTERTGPRDRCLLPGAHPPSVGAA
jgi:hypothetical protein